MGQRDWSDQFEVAVASVGADAAHTRADGAAESAQVTSGNDAGVSPHRTGAEDSREVFAETPEWASEDCAAVTIVRDDVIQRRRTRMNLVLIDDHPLFRAGVRQALL